ncbi:hypothetical protein [Sabulibacter ruber]|uniref:hypothetical protein n=1 Tax=Sabulibacter ruber TaxID=2811901 RepID=UPI001A967A90|nr:hypothetical protein [Sabulibacter ruber]
MPIGEINLFLFHTLQQYEHSAKQSYPDSKRFNTVVFSEVIGKGQFFEADQLRVSEVFPQNQAKNLLQEESSTIRKSAFCLAATFGSDGLKSTSGRHKHPSLVGSVSSDLSKQARKQTPTKTPI